MEETVFLGCFPLIVSCLEFLPNKIRRRANVGIKEIAVIFSADPLPNLPPFCFSVSSAVVAVPEPKADCLVDQGEATSSSTDSAVCLFMVCPAQ